MQSLLNKIDKNYPITKKIDMLLDMNKKKFVNFILIFEIRYNKYFKNEKI